MVFIVAAVVVLAVAGAVLGFTVLAAASVKTLPTTGEWAPLTWQKPLTKKDFIPNYLHPPHIDPDSMIRSGIDINTTLRLVSPNTYRLHVQNVSGMGYINSFHWFPPGGMVIQKVVRSNVGDCQLTGTQGAGGNLFKSVLLNPEIKCQGISLKPPSCTCVGDGGKLDIVFTVAPGSYKGGLMAGSVRIEAGTPVLKTIRSYYTDPDLPVCKAGTLGTKAHPCVPSGQG